MLSSMPLSGYKCQTLRSWQSKYSKNTKKHSFFNLTFVYFLMIFFYFQTVKFSLVTCLRNVLFSCKQNDIIVFHCYL